MPRQTQFGARKNPAPHSRQHGLCLAADANSENALPKVTPQGPEQVELNSRMNELQSPSHAAPLHAATVGEATTNHDRLLTIREVAEMLQVPISWIYCRTRKRSLERLPGYRLGKYWRFDRDEVLTWVQRQRKDFRAV
jgi:excisionase family DNA binding protein